MKFVLYLCIAWATWGAPATLTPSPEGAKVYFVNIKSGDKVKSPVKILFGLTGMGVAPAGTDKEKTGHHHLIVDSEVKNFSEAIPADANHLHFGGGQTETSLALTPGKHTLQLVVGDFRHIPHQPPIISEKIFIEVQK